MGHFYPIHPFLKNHQDVTQFDYPCMYPNVQRDMSPPKEGQGKYMIPWVPEQNKGYNERGSFGYHQ